VSEADCQGAQTSEWSRDGERLFTHVDVTCNGRPARTVSGVTVLTKGATWVDVQATEIDGDSQVRIRRYQRTIEHPYEQDALPADVAARAMADALTVSASTMNLEDVVEASKKVSPAALEATLDETNASFNLNSRALRQLADSGVSLGVIDLMVAQSFPSEFRVDRRPTFAPPAPYSGTMGGTTMGGIYGYDPYYPYYSYYSPFAYPYWGVGYNYYSNYYNNFYGGRTYLGGLGGVPYGYGIPIGGGGGNIIVNPGDNTPGQVVNGRGYTRVSPGSANTNAAGGDESSPASHTTTSPRGVRSSSPDSGGVSSSGYSNGGSSGSSNSGSSGGASAPSGGGGDSGGRTAQPR
jgi:hypothetical protein